jgi:type II secretory pathway pseudopilin PulG
MPALTSILVGALVASAASAAVGTGVSIANAQSGKKAQDKAMQQQKQAQDQAVEQAQSQARRSEYAANAANRKTPDLNAIMQSASQAARGGPSGTMLTGPGGVDPNSLALGKNSLLGS